MSRPAPAMPSLRRTIKRWWRVNKGWFQYKLRHPFAPFHEYYVEVVERRLDRGEVHVTLGERSVQSESFDTSGRRILDVLRDQGLEPQHSIVDYGCGSLRIGRLLIEYLAPGKYTGLDVTPRFFTEGLETLSEELVAEKRPHLAVISEAEAERLAQDPPDFIVSIGVLIHVPRNELRTFLASCLGPCTDGTRAFISFLEEERHAKIGDLTWAWPAETLVAELAAMGFDAEVVDRQVDGFPAAAPGRSRCVLRVTRSAG